MSIILGALGGAGQALESVYGERMRADLQRENAMAENEQRSNLELQRQQTMEVLRNNLQQAPLKRIGLIAQARQQNSQIPVEPEPVVNADGSADKQNFSPDAPIHANMSGSYAALVQAQNDPKSQSYIQDPAERKQYLDALAGQFARQSDEAKAAVAGKTRSMTSDEAFDAAMAYAKVNDPAAYAAGQASIRKPEREERRLDNQEARQASQDAINNRRLDIQQQFNEERARIQDRLAYIAERRSQRGEDRTAAQMDKAELQSTRQALTSVLKDIATSEDKIQMKMLDPMITPEQKAVLEGQFKSLDRDRLQARNELLKLAGVEPPAPQKQDVTVGGKVIGQASTPEEAQALVAQWKTANAGQAGNPPASTASKPPAQSPTYNEAGYTSVDSTIDGARRGDQKAIALLQQMIARGETSPAQRQEIAKITGQK